MRPVQIPYFRIWYSLTFVILFLAALLLTLISPADLIFQTVHGGAGPKTNVISVAATYLGTLLACAFLWAARLYTNRAVLAAIPKSYLPITAADLPAKVRRLVGRNARRSALVAWDSRPHDVSRELAGLDVVRPATAQPHHAHLHLHLHSQRRPEGDAGIIAAATARKAWGPLEHAGWAAPRATATSAAGAGLSGGRGAAPAAPAVRYAAIIAELPHLLEAKAVSLAPPLAQHTLTASAAPATAAAVHDARSDAEAEAAAAAEADPALVALLRRPDGAGLRAYVAHLVALGLVPAAGRRAGLPDVFVRRYEDVRFAGRAVGAREFEALMESFAMLLASLRLPDGGVEVLDSVVDDEDGVQAEDEGDDGESSGRYAVSDSRGSGSVRRLSRVVVGGSPYETSDFYSFGEDDDDTSLRAAQGDASPYETSAFHSINSEASSFIAYHQRDNDY